MLIAEVFAIFVVGKVVSTSALLVKSCTETLVKLSTLSKSTVS